MYTSLFVQTCACPGLSPHECISFELADSHCKRGNYCLSPKAGRPTQIFQEEGQASGSCARGQAQWGLLPQPCTPQGPLRDRGGELCVWGLFRLHLLCTVPFFFLLFPPLLFSLTAWLVSMRRQVAPWLRLRAANSDRTWVQILLCHLLALGPWASDPLEASVSCSVKWPQ